PNKVFTVPPLPDLWVPGAGPPSARPFGTRGGGGKPPPPQRPHPGGGDGCRGWSSDRKRRCFYALAFGKLPGRVRNPPREVGPPTGATDAGGAASNSCQPFPTGGATKRGVAPFFTRTRTLRLPWVRASAITSRTSAGVETDLPATSRITSPVEKPWSAAIPVESTPVTATPSAPAPATRAAGARVRPSLPISVPLPPSSELARASLVFGNSPRLRLIFFSVPL